MSHIRDAIVDDWVARLNATGAPCPAERCRVFAVPATADLFNVYWTEEDSEPVGHPQGASIYRRELSGVVEFRTRDEVNASAGSVWIEKQLAGQSHGDRNGNLYYWTHVKRSAIEVEQHDHAYVLLRVYLTARYQTRVGDPAFWA